MSTESTNLASFNYKGVFVAVTIDARKWVVTKRDELGKPIEHDQSQKLPVAIRVTKDSKRNYILVGDRYTWDEWIELCRNERKTRCMADLKQRNSLKKVLEDIKPMICEMVDENTFSFHRLKERFLGTERKDVTIYSVWDEIIQKKRDSGKAGTARCNEDVRKRFERDMGKNVEFSDIDSGFIQKWTDVMRKKGLNITTIGISLRSFRAIVNVCIDKKYMRGNTKEMFKDTGYNKSSSRKHEFLDVGVMRRLYDFWKKGEAKDPSGKELFPKKVKAAIFRDLGLFLFMYLGDGQNLADTLRLTYDGWYYATKGKQLRFTRHKTRDRNENASEVIFPVTKEIGEIIRRHGNEPALDRRVFPIMSEFLTPDKEIWVIQRYNRYIREHMKIVANLLGLEQCPSPTWARHSFATNLNNSGCVPYKYISDSMGHSSSGDITSNYIGTYPLEKMLEYNSYLLRENKPTDKKTELLDILKDMSAEERAEFMREVQNFDND